MSHNAAIERVMWRKKKKKELTFASGKYEGRCDLQKSVGSHSSNSGHNNLCHTSKMPYGVVSTEKSVPMLPICRKTFDVSHFAAFITPL